MDMINKSYLLTETMIGDANGTKGSGIYDGALFRQSKWVDWSDTKE